MEIKIHQINEIYNDNKECITSTKDITNQIDKHKENFYKENTNENTNINKDIDSSSIQNDLIGKKNILHQIKKE